MTYSNQFDNNFCLRHALNHSMMTALWLIDFVYTFCVVIVGIGANNQEIMRE